MGRGRISLTILIAATFLGFGLQSHADVWDVKKNWDSAIAPDTIIPGTHQSFSDYCSDTSNKLVCSGLKNYEDLYSQFVSSEIDHSYFVLPKSLYKDAMDCGKMPYFVRAIFAYTYKLPFSAVGNSINQKTNLYNGITDPDKRVSAFLDQSVRPNVSADTLAEDTYPVEINRKYIHPGTILYEGHDRNAYKPDARHVNLVKELSDNGDLSFISATVGCKKDLHAKKSGNVDPDEICDNPLGNKLNNSPSFSMLPKESRQDGFRNWRHFDRPLDSEPGYSKEQYSLTDDVNSFDVIVKDRLMLSPTLLEDDIERAANGVCDAVKMCKNDGKERHNCRLKQTKGAWKYKVDHHFMNMDSSPDLVETYSTPNMDHNLQRKMIILENYMCQAKTNQTKNIFFKEIVYDDNGNLAPTCSTPVVHDPDGTYDPQPYLDIQKRVFDKCDIYYEEGEEHRTLHEIEMDLLMDPDPRDTSVPLCEKNDLTPTSKKICRRISSDPNDPPCKRWGDSCPGETRDSSSTRTLSSPATVD